MIRTFSIICFALAMVTLTSISFAEDADTLAINVPENKDYKLVYDMDLNKMAKDIKYTVDNSESAGKFSRVAYYLELTPKEGDPQWVYVSLDAFSDDAKLVGIPTMASKANFQQEVKNLTVLSNVDGVKTGTDIDGNIEFWPNNYQPANKVKVPDADDKKFDFGDGISMPEDGYGSMQVHNTKEKQTIFALNHWVTGNQADLGIGNNPAGNPDWTFTKSAGKYTTKRLRVLILPAK